MNFFTEIPECQIIILTSGTYRQVAGYERAGRIYAKIGSGYVRLNQHGSTSHPKAKWIEIETPNGQWVEAGGYVTYSANGVA